MDESNVTWANDFMQGLTHESIPYSIGEFINAIMNESIIEIVNQQSKWSIKDLLTECINSLFDGLIN